MDNSKGLLISPATVAEELEISRSRAYELIKSGAIPSVRIGNSLRVPRAALERMIEQQLKDD